MRLDKAATHRRFTSRVVPIVVTGIVVVALAGCSSGGSDPAAQANLTITPGPYHAGQLINVSVGPNHYFTPYSGIKILECADPGGTTSTLPTNISACDGNTIQGGSILVNADGSFSIQGYEVFALPNAAQLGEPDDNRPVCNQSNDCVLYIGQNQEKFTAPQDLVPTVQRLEVEQPYMNTLRYLPSGRTAGLCFAAFCMSLAVESSLVQVAGASGAPPAVSVSPQGNLSAGETISVAVGPNSYFTPNAGIKILECADPGGTVANLPKDITACDGNTVEGGTVLVGSDGSFSDPSYPVYLLPSSLLAEPGDSVPVCNQTHYCVLYVGQSQNDFSAPKVFSSSFLVTEVSGATTTTAVPPSSGPSLATTSTTMAAKSVPATTTSAGGAAADPATSVSGSADLANTGPPPVIAWVAASGMALLLVGAMGRRLALRRSP